MLRTTPPASYNSPQQYHVLVQAYNNAAGCQTVGLLVRPLHGAIADRVPAGLRYHVLLTSTAANSKAMSDCNYTRTRSDLVAYSTQCPIPGRLSLACCG